MMNRNGIRRYALYFAWIVSLIATLGSLYFSEVKGFIPCNLCWFQRICMYPQSIILGIAAYHNDLRIKRYILPLSVIGAAISLFHYLEQKLPFLSEVAKVCVSGVPCTTTYMNWFGFITIPFLALIAFGLITFFMVITKTDDENA